MPLHLSKPTPPLLEVITLGRNIGAVLFNDGRRVRNSPLNELYTSSLGATVSDRSLWLLQTCLPYGSVTCFFRQRFKLVWTLLCLAASSR